MKKLLLISALAIIATLSSYGQGSVSFANGNTTRVFLKDGTTPVPAGGQFLAELMYAPDGTPAAAFDAAATRVGGTSTFGGTLGIAGTFNGGGRTITTITPSGGFGMFQVRVWEAAAGNSYAEALLGGNSQYQAGKSGVLRVDTGDPTLSPPQTPASLITAGLQSFALQPIPEPSVIALSLLGAGALLMLRRRK